MEEILKLLVGIIVLLLGIPIGDYVAKLTREELRQGWPWFRLIIMVSVFGAIASLILGNDMMLFTFLFIAIVTSRSLVRRIKPKA